MHTAKKEMNSSYENLMFTDTAEKIKEHFSYIPEELHLKKVELNRAETRIRNFIEFVAEGRATSSLSNALESEEKKAKTLKLDVKSLESAKNHAFEPPPREWLQHRLNDLKDLLEQRTEKSALTIRRLTGPITLTPKKPEVGREYYHAYCKFKSFSLLEDNSTEKSGAEFVGIKKPQPLQDCGSNTR